MQELRSPWCIEDDVIPACIEYKKAGYTKTRGTVVMSPPSNEYLRQAFFEPHKGTVLTVGARALCKHHARRTDHPFWKMPAGRPDDKNLIAAEHLEDILNKSTWKNIFRLHSDVIILEMRVDEGYGMRWRIASEGIVECPKFLGYLEPQLMKTSEKMS